MSYWSAGLQKYRDNEILNYQTDGACTAHESKNIKFHPYCSGGYCSGVVSGVSKVSGFLTIFVKRH
jgi:hypothetical protein